MMASNSMFNVTARTGGNSLYNIYMHDRRVIHRYNSEFSGMPLPSMQQLTHCVRAIFHLAGAAMVPLSSFGIVALWEKHTLLPLIARAFGTMF